MMLPTHIIIGLLVGVAFIYLYPSLVDEILIAAFIGSVIPDIDMFFGKHRKTLHYPIISLFLTTVVLSIFLITGEPVALLVGVLTLCMSVHSLTDILGSGWEQEPWESTEDRAVYDHVRGEWVKANRLIDYDGSWKDLFLLLCGCVLFVLLTPAYAWIIVILFAVGLVYTIFRKTLFSPTYIKNRFPRLYKISEYFRDRFD